MDFKKLIKIVLINILILVALFSLVEFYFYKKSEASNAGFIKQYIKMLARSTPNADSTFRYVKVRNFDFNIDKKDFRKTVYGSKAKRPLLFFVCSFTYGDGLRDNQTLPYKMSKLTGRTAYNRAISGWGAQHMLYQLRLPDFKKEVPDAEYIIYTFIYMHVRRLSQFNVCDFSNESMLRYKLQNGELVELKPLFMPLYSLFTVKYAQRALARAKLEDLSDEMDLFLRIMQESKKISDKKYPNSKFVILIYKDAPHINDDVSFQYKALNSLKKEGFIVVDAQKLAGNSLAGKEYLVEDDFHPSEKAWDLIAPKLVNYLKL